MGTNNCNTNLTCFLPELAELAGVITPKWGGSAHDGCLFAVNQSLIVVNGALHRNADSFFFEFGTNISDIEDAATRGVTICDNDDGTAPEVLVPYSWCSATIPGWHIAGLGGENKADGGGNEWAGPLVQFILPCIAFCYNIPRQWKLNVSPWKGCSWKSLKAVRRAILESKIIEYVEQGLFRRHRFQRLTARLNPTANRYSRILKQILYAVARSCRWVLQLLFALLIVALDTIYWITVCFACAGPMMLSAAYEYVLDWRMLECMAAFNLSAKSRAHLLLCSLVGNVKIETELSGLLLNTRRRSDSLDSTWCQVMELADRVGVQSQVPALEVQLRALLNAQPSFGGVVGSPIAFFIGGFVYSIFDSEANLEAGDTAMTLAFGMWWMTIPHLALIANSLLASNDPSTFRGMVGEARVCKYGDTSPFPPLTCKAYESNFEPVVLWERGQNKYYWYSETLEALIRNNTMDSERAVLADLRDTIDLQLFHRTIVILIALSLLGVPFGFGFATSYVTPQAGLSCRSLVHLIYFVSQLFLMALWGFEAFLYGLAPPDSYRPLKPSVWLLRICGCFVLAVAITASIGGTIMQTLGVFNTCLCSVNTWDWTGETHSTALISLSSVTKASIAAAQLWVRLGIAASAVLALAAAVCWWHQRGLRELFVEQTEKLRMEAEPRAADGR